ncbi:MAG: TRAP transporter large permease subunit [Deltaproteobacteria bacterium]|nr:TRAP transporter large permease subunit [Deltaproteobacteria bacterium]
MSDKTIIECRHPFLYYCINILRPLEKLSEQLSSFGMIFFIIASAMTFADVFLRYLFHRPFNGTVELTEIMMAVIVFSSVSYTQWKKNHVTMDIITAKLRPDKRDILDLSTTIWSLAIIGYTIYAMFPYGWSTTKVTSILGIPLNPFIFFAILGVSLLWLTLLYDAMVLLSRVRRKYYAFIVTSSALPILAGYWLASHRLVGMSSAVVGLTGLTAMFLLFFLGMPIPFALMGTGFVFVANLRGIFPSTIMLGSTWYDTVASYSWSPLVSFMFMGFLCFYARFGEDLYTTARLWLGHKRGGLAIATVCACSLFGAVVGDVLAGSVAMAAIALPEMRKAGYMDDLSVGTLACSGTIGTLIPPSVVLIIYGVLSEQSIASLFIAGIVPGIICASLFILSIWMRVYFKPELAPRLIKDKNAEISKSLVKCLPILSIFILVIGGIYTGAFTANEGGSIGVIGTLILGLIMGRIRMKELRRALHESANFISMTFTIIGGSIVIGYLLSISRIPYLISNSIASLNTWPMLILIAIILSMCVMGCFFPNIPLLLICIPIFLPLAKFYQWDLIWFGVLMTLVFNLASITPPFGISLFVMKGIADIPLARMYKAAIPFVLALILSIVICIIFPIICTILV